MVNRYKVGDKVIISNKYNIYSWLDGRLDLMYKFRDKILDMYKVFMYLENGDTTKIDKVIEVLNEAQRDGQSKNIDLDFFEISVYKKGTTHIVWKNKELVQKFNLFAARYKNELPPSYGFKTYDEMDSKEKSFIDGFEGKESYENVVNNKDYFLQDIGESILMLGGGE